MDATFYMENTVFNYRAAGVLIEKDHVLLHKQADDDHWALPGGRVKVLEDSQTSIEREIKEELAFSVKVNHLLWFAECFFNYDDSQFHEIGLYYSLSSSNQSVTFSEGPFCGEEGERLIYKWVPIDELETINLYPEFLKTGLKKLPKTPEHLVIKEYEIM